jgi:copper homeostasis protein
VKVIIEACCGSVAEAWAAVEGKADRIELCAALPTGGVTPTVGMLEASKERCSLPVVSMVRPKEGGPVIDKAEFRACLKDVKALVRAGSEEIITGFLNSDMKLDKEKNKALIEAAEGVPVALHRVFDMAPDLDRALEEAIELGFCRILTSGGAPDVDQGFDTLARLVQRAGDRITILAGGGVRLHNAKKLVTEGGLKEIHFSFRRRTHVLGYQGDPDTLPDHHRLLDVRQSLAG